MEYKMSVKQPSTAVLVKGTKLYGDWYSFTQLFSNEEVKQAYNEWVSYSAEDCSCRVHSITNKNGQVRHVEDHLVCARERAWRRYVALRNFANPACAIKKAWG